MPNVPRLPRSGQPALASIPTVVALAMSLALLACSDGPTEPRSPVRTMTMQIAHDSLFLGKTTRVMATATGDSTVGANPRFTWTSSDTTVAVVDSGGLVLGTGIGSARITAELLGRRESVVVRVVLQRADGGVTFTEGSGNDGAFTRICVASGGAVYCRAPATAADTAPVFRRQPGAAGLQLSSANVSLHAVCALASDGRVFCWGSNAHYIFGHRNAVVTDTGPVAVRTDLRFSQLVHTGHAQSCGIERESNVVYCWGHNDAYQLANGTLSAQDSTPKPVAGNLRAQRVYTANFSTCILDPAGAAHCAGSLNVNRRVLGIEDSDRPAETLLPVAGGRAFRMLAVGDSYQCGIDQSADAWCWGRNPAGQLGSGDRDPNPPFGMRRVTGTLKFTTIATPYRESSCGITLGGDLYCWGLFHPRSISNRLGDRVLTPFHLARGVKFRSLIVGAAGMCATAVDGRTYCW